MVGFDRWVACKMHENLFLFIPAFVMVLIYVSYEVDIHLPSHTYLCTSVDHYTNFAHFVYELTHQGNVIHYRVLQSAL
jgi:hypothetical protein